MKKVIITAILFCLISVVLAQKIDTVQVFKVGMGKALDQYIKACYSDSSEVMAQYYFNGKDTLACDVKQAPPAGSINLYRKKVWIHSEATPDKFISWIYYEFKKPKK